MTHHGATSYTVSMTPICRWQVKRGDFVMAVFPTREGAETYAAAKRAAEVNHEEQRQAA